MRRIQVKGHANGHATYNEGAEASSIAGLQLGHIAAPGVRYPDVCPVECQQGWVRAHGEGSEVDPIASPSLPGIADSPDGVGTIVAHQQ